MPGGRPQAPDQYGSAKSACARENTRATSRPKNGIAAHEGRLTVYIATKVRTGLTPAVNALGLILIALTVIAAATYELSRRNNRAKSVRSNSG